MKSVLLYFGKRNLKLGETESIPRLDTFLISGSPPIRHVQNF